METFMDYYEFSNDFSEIFSTDFCDDEFSNDFSEIFSTDFCEDDTSLALLVSEDYPVDLFNPSEWICEEQSSPEDVSTGEVVNQPPLSFPVADMEGDRKLSIFHLLKAYGEAMVEGLVELSQVILIRLFEKASPIGTTMERLSHYLLQQSDTQSEYLKQECIKNYALAFRAFYEITPYGRFAHFVANASIQESLPRDKETIHFIDFDVADGIQWPPLLATLRPRQSVRITCIDLEEEEEEEEEEDHKFKRVKGMLESFARTMGPKVRVDKMRLGELLLEKRRLSTSARESESLVFNCMVGLPHMGVANKKQRSQVEEFIRVGQELIASPSTCGMLTYGTCSSGLTKFSEGHIVHSHALFESMEWHFQSDLSLARTTMENLFLGECVSSSSSSVFIDEISIGSKLKGCRISKQNVLEANEMVRGGHYEVKVGGYGGNEMILEWKNTQLVRVSAWA